MGYRSGQRAAFAGLVIGFLLCVTGAIAPFWQVGNVKVGEISGILEKLADIKIPFIDSLTLIKSFGGLWWYCVEPIGIEQQCQAYDLGDAKAVDWAIRIACVVNVVLTLVCALVALCRTCCCTGGKTIFHGIIAFIAGAAGITCVGLFAGTSNEGFAMKLMNIGYGWAFFIYIAGSVIVTMVSFVLCFASPNNPFTPVIINSVGHMLPTSNRYYRMQDQNSQLGGVPEPVGAVRYSPGGQSY